MKSFSFALVLVTSLVFVCRSLASKPTYACGAALERPSFSVGLLAIGGSYTTDVEALVWYGRRRRRWKFCVGDGAARCNGPEWG